uniref:Uncharacterized protein n=1 Tax=viral metagenome TaxID=1070528 RepID=A0A6C0E3V5_9ZZZZ
MNKSIILKCSMYLHMICEFITCFYIFLFPKSFDLLFVIYLLVVVLLKLIFKYECIWSVLDKKLINPRYVLGSNPTYYPFRDYLYGNDYIVIIIGLLIFYELFVIYFRNKGNNIIQTIVLINVAGIFFIEMKIKKYI